MADNSSLTTQEKKLETEVQDMHLKEEDRDADMGTGSEEERSTPQSAAEGDTHEHRTVFAVAE
jgi:hypothetical protein